MREPSVTEKINYYAPWLNLLNTIVQLAFVSDLGFL